MTRPDISDAGFAVTRISHNPTERHWKAVLKILGLPPRDQVYGIDFVRGPGLDLPTCSDVDCADKSNGRRSVSVTVTNRGECGRQLGKEHVEVSYIVHSRSRVCRAG